MKLTSVLGMLAAALMIAGCSTATHDDADVAFAQGMIPHHTQAVAMSQLVAGRTSNPAVVGLAGDIARAQAPEIAQMQGFLQRWGVTPATDMGRMPGMISDQQLQQLGTATGAAFDRLFLQEMTEHHTGAISMAQTELRDGRDADARALAQQIVGAQQSEIVTMEQLLAAG